MPACFPRTYRSRYGREGETEGVRALRVVATAEKMLHVEPSCSDGWTLTSRIDERRAAPSFPSCPPLRPSLIRHRYATRTSRRQSRGFVAVPARARVAATAWPSSGAFARCAACAPRSLLPTRRKGTRRRDVPRRSYPPPPIC